MAASHGATASGTATVAADSDCGRTPSQQAGSALAGGVQAPLPVTVAVTPSDWHCHWQPQAASEAASEAASATASESERVTGTSITSTSSFNFKLKFATRISKLQLSMQSFKKVPIQSCQCCGRQVQGATCAGGAHTVCVPVCVCVCGSYRSGSQARRNDKAHCISHPDCLCS